MHNQILRYGLKRITKSCALAHSTEIISCFYCRAAFNTEARSAYPNSPQWSIVQNQIRRSGPIALKDLKIEYLDEFKSIFDDALDHESGNLLGTFGEMT
jgi:hypothetical protein